MPWWGKSSDLKEFKPDEAQNEKQSNPHFDATNPRAEKLPKELQKIVDKSDKDSTFFQNVAKG